MSAQPALRDPGVANASPREKPDPPATPGRWTRGHVPGEVGIWVFVLGDLCVFGVFFGIFLVARAGDPDVFAAARPEVNQTLGAVNMLVLLTSSLLVARAVHAFRDGRRDLARRLFLGAALCGAAFLAVKGVEYGQKLSAGVDPGTNDFFMYYFIFTGIHALHVVLGLLVLVLLRHISGKAEPGQHDVRTIESGATFWHMVDLLWVVLFPIIYLSA